ncbi:MAG: RIP metalloprotease RseP [Eubacterium sp.]|nr:RIP metalloprotease RseP [Eubacterium sp.]
MSIIIAIFIFGLIIIFHEFGHCIVAKKNGIRVEEFCIGLGPTLFGVQKGETKYSVKLLPFGGACIMTGEEGDSDDERAFCNKSVWARIAVVFAGPGFNFILAFFLALILIGCIGIDKPFVASVTEGSAADAAGLQAGDRIVELDGHSVRVYREISNYLTLNPSKVDDELTIVYERDGETYTTSLTPVYDEEDGKYYMGFSGGTRTRIGPFEVIGYSLYEVKYWINITVDSLRLIFTGGVSVSEVSGPVGIVDTIGSTYRESVAISYFAAFINMVNISILLTANLGVMNLLPIPALDGGRLVFLIIEVFRRKRMDPDKEGMVHFVGLMILLGLMIVIMVHDVYKLF